MMSRTFAALLVCVLLAGIGGCSKGNDGSSGTPPTSQSSGDAAFGKTTPPSTGGLEGEGWEVQGGGEQTSGTQPPVTTTPTAPTVPATIPTGGNKSPVVSAVTLDPSGSTVAKGGAVHITVTASDPDGDSLQYNWGTTGGTFDSTDGFRAVWRTPDMTGTFVVTVTISDGKGGTISAQQSFNVVANNNPVIQSLTTSASAVGPGASVIVSGVADDPDGDPVTYKWSADGGVITGTGQNITWVAPQVSPGGQDVYTIQLTVEDGHGGVTIKSTDIKEASLKFTYKQTVGDPFNLALGIGGVRVWIVRFPADKLPGYQLDPVQELTTQPLRESPNEFDLTTYAKRIGQNLSIDDLVQLMVGFQRATNNDGVEDSMAWTNATLTVTYAPA